MDHTGPKSSKNTRTAKAARAACDVPARPNGLRCYPAYFSAAQQRALLADVEAVLAAAPLYRPAMPRSGKPLSVRMTNAGPLGWVTDKDGGYRYQPFHPETLRPWPSIPEPLLAMWQTLARYPVAPEACLINLYEQDSKLGSHVDADEADTNAPVVSVSLGADAIFHIGGPRRRDPKSKLILQSGDVIVLGGDARRCHHGIDRILPTMDSLLSQGRRINLTLRRVTVPQC